MFDLCCVVCFSEKDILNHDDEYEPFFSSFVALASHYLSSSAGDGEFKQERSQRLYHVEAHQNIWRIKRYLTLLLYFQIANNKALIRLRGCAG